MNPQILQIIEYDLAGTAVAKKLIDKLEFDDESLMLIYEYIQYHDTFAKIYELLTAEQRNRIWDLLNNKILEGGKQR